MDSHFFDELKIKFLQLMHTLSSKKGDFPIRKVMLYVFYIFMTLAVLIYIYSIFFNIRQITVMKETGIKLEEVLVKVQEEAKNFTKGKIVEKEGEDTITVRDYVYNFYKYTQEISKTQSIPIVFKNVKIDEQDPKVIHLEITFVKFLSIDKILRYAPEGKSFLKLRLLDVKYEYLQDYDLAYYTMTLEGRITQYGEGDSNAKTPVKEE